MGELPELNGKLVKVSVLITQTVIHPLPKSSDKVASIKSDDLWSQRGNFLFPFSPG